MFDLDQLFQKSELIPVIIQHARTKDVDYIVTAGKGGIYPPGLRIGKITEIKPDSDGLTVYATVEPFADIRNVSSVFVITDFAEKNQLEE